MRFNRHVERYTRFLKFPAIGRDVWRWAPADTAMADKLADGSVRCGPPDKLVMPPPLPVAVPSEGQQSCLFDHVTEPYAGIIARCHDIKFVIRHDDIDGDGRVSGCK